MNVYDFERPFSHFNRKASIRCKTRLYHVQPFFFFVLRRIVRLRVAFSAGLILFCPRLDYSLLIFGSIWGQGMDTRLQCIGRQLPPCLFFRSFEILIK